MIAGVTMLQLINLVGNGFDISRIWSLALDSQKNSKIKNTYSIKIPLKYVMIFKYTFKASNFFRKLKLFLG